MTAPTVDPVCLCGDRQSEHRLGRRGCKAIDCGCGEFEAADDVRSGNAQPDYAQAEECKPAHSAPGQSTSARLREALAANDELATEHARCVVELERLRTELHRTHEAGLQLIKERDEWRERSGHFEKRAVDQLAATVAAQRTAPVEIHGWDAFQCFTCGSRYRINFDHEHGPLTAVRVSITER